MELRMEWRNYCMFMSDSGSYLYYKMWKKSKSDSILLFSQPYAISSSFSATPILAETVSHPT